LSRLIRMRMFAAAIRHSRHARPVESAPARHYSRQRPKPRERDLASERSEALEFIRSSGGRAVFCTSIDPYKMHNPGFAGHAIRELNQDFKQGAIAVKI